MEGKEVGESQSTCWESKEGRLARVSNVWFTRELLNVSDVFRMAETMTTYLV